MKKAMFTFAQGGKQHRTYLLIAWGLFLLFVLVLPHLLGDRYYLVSRLNRALFMAVAILGMNLVIGYSGLIALGHSAFIGIGAFTTASLVQDEGWDYWMTIPVSMLLTFFVGVLLGIPALRIKGLYLALVTVAFASVFPSLAKMHLWGIDKRTGGVNGKKIDERVAAPEWLQGIIGIGNTPDEQAVYRYYIIAILSGLAWLLTRNLIKSRSGRAIIAIRDNETGAAVSGINLPLYKVLTFGVSASLGGLAGVMWSMDRAFAAEQDFTFVLAIDLLVGLVIGGVATLQGGLIGALVVVFVRELTKGLQIPLGFTTIDGAGPLSQAIFGVILILVTFFAPGGLASLTRKIKAKVIQVVPQPPPEALVARDAAMA
ncbi:MAG: branched-chain amino acid ABC transporter permease [Actinomycetota bacterium]|nr:branched-chain amino acid ABC transporter permease [Actinomycetota bacterium]